MRLLPSSRSTIALREERSSGVDPRAEPDEPMPEPVPEAESTGSLPIGRYSRPMVSRQAKAGSGQYSKLEEPSDAEEIRASEPPANDRDSIPVASETRPRVREPAVEESNLVGVETSKARFYMFVAPRSGKKTA